MARFLLNDRLAVVQLAAAPATLAAPTQAEITAGVDCIGAQGSEELEEIQGFEVQPSFIGMPGYAKLTVPNLAGEQTFPDSRLSFYEDDVVQVIKSTFPDLSTGFLCFMRQGIGVGNESVVFSYQVASNVPRQARNVVAEFDVNVSITSETKGTQAA